MDQKTAKKRLFAVLSEIRSKGLDGVIITTPENVSYLTGFMGEDSWVCIIGRKVFFLTDSRYTEQAEDECVGCKIIDNQRGMIKAVGKLFSKYRSAKIVGLEEKTSVAVFKAVQKELKVKVKPVGGIVESVRIIKDTEEVRTIRKACQIAWSALDRTLKHLRAGMMESEAAGMLDFQMRKQGAGVGFETIVAFGPNGSRNHHQPGRRKLRKNDTILIDFGAKVDGYTNDVTRSFVFGRAPELYKKVYYTVAAAQRGAIETIRAGAKLVDIDTAARKVIADAGLEVYGHGTGHGIGLEVHELPFMSKVSKGILEEGQVVTVEPGIYLPGKFGVRIEDDVLVTKTGCEIVSKDSRYGFSDAKMPVLKSR